MPCDMMRGATSGDFAANEVRDLERRVAALEAAFCGLCQQLVKTDGLHPALLAWFDAHRRRPGCAVGESQGRPVSLKFPVQAAVRLLRLPEPPPEVHYILRVNAGDIGRVTGHHAPDLVSVAFEFGAMWVLERDLELIDGDEE